MNEPYLCRNFFLIDWRHKRLKNTIDLLLLYGENFYGFSERGLSHSFNLKLQQLSSEKVLRFVLLGNCSSDFFTEI